MNTLISIQRGLEAFNSWADSIKQTEFGAWMILGQGAVQLLAILLFAFTTLWFFCYELQAMASKSRIFEPILFKRSHLADFERALSNAWYILSHKDSRRIVSDLIESQRAVTHSLKLSQKLRTLHYEHEELLDQEQQIIGALRDGAKSLATETDALQEITPRITDASDKLIDVSMDRGKLRNHHAAKGHFQFELILRYVAKRPSSVRQLVRDFRSEIRGDDELRERIGVYLEEDTHYDWALEAIRKLKGQKQSQSVTQ